MNSAEHASDIKRVGKSGQISLGKQHAGRYYREERHPDGTIVLSPVVVVSESHWTVRDAPKIRRALAWASETPPRASDVDALAPGPTRSSAGKRRAR